MCFLSVINFRVLETGRFNLQLFYRVREDLLWYFSKIVCSFFYCSTINPHSFPILIQYVTINLEVICPAHRFVVSEQCE